MLASRNRLTASGQFQDTVRRGQRAGGPLLVVHLLAPAARTGQLSDAVEPPRAGFVVSRAVGPAVTRNRVKRRLRHLVREQLADLPHGALLVVRALPPAAHAQSAELRVELGRCLGKVRRSPVRPRAGAEARP